MRTSELLIKAREILSKPYAWVKGKYRGQVRYRNKSYDCYCSVGALLEAVGYNGLSAGASCDASVVDGARVISRVLGHNPRPNTDVVGQVIDWNDKPKRTKKEVLEVFTKAIERAERAEKRVR